METYADRVGDVLSNLLGDLGVEITPDVTTLMRRHLKSLDTAVIDVEEVG